jgi:hypothetical protein
MTPRLGAVTVTVFAVLAVVSCATSSGTLVDRVHKAEAADEKETVITPPKGVEGLEVQTDPDGAEVWLNDRYQGTTPLVIGGLKKGTYRLLIARKGYHEIVVWLDYHGGSMSYQVVLDPILGFVQVDVIPSDASVTLDDKRISRGITPVPVGSYSVKVSAFGYTEWRGRIEVWENIVTPIEVELEPAVFAISPPSIARPVVNPENPGMLGNLETRFDVTGPGSASVTVFDWLGHQVHQDSLPEFRTWSQRWSWHPAAATPDGDYTLVISGLGRDGVESRQESYFSIDRTARIAPRSSWSGSAGLLYVPAAETLPLRSFQASLIGVAYVDSMKDQLQAPLQLSFRTGLGGNMELDATGGAIMTGAAVPPVFGSLSLRWQFVEPTRPVGVGVAVEGKAAIQGVPGRGILTTDTFANFSGISLGVPIQLRIGQVSLLAEAAFLASAWRVDYDSDPVTSASPASWMYWKAGLMLDTGAFVAGVSASARSLPLPDGFLSIGLPVQAGVEFHWLLPGTHILLGGTCAGEFESPASLYWMGGISLGLLF